MSDPYRTGDPPKPESREPWGLWLRRWIMWRRASKVLQAQVLVVTTGALSYGITRLHRSHVIEEATMVVLGLVVAGLAVIRFISIIEDSD